MPAPVETIAAITNVFRQYGYEGASLSRISVATGLGRSSLYHHFPNGKEDMAKEAVAHVAEVFRQRVLSALDGDGDPKARLATALSEINRFYDQGRSACLGDVFGLADAIDAAPGAAGGLLRALVEGFAALSRSAGAPKPDAARRAERAVALIEGSLILSRAFGDEAPFQRALEHLASDFFT